MTDYLPLVLSELRSLRAEVKAAVAQRESSGSAVRWLSCAQAAARCGVSLKAFRCWLDAQPVDRPPRYYHGTRLQFRPLDIDRWWEAHQTRARGRRSKKVAA